MIKVLERDNGKGCNCVSTFLCDATSDVSSLPTATCSAGSIALVAEPTEGEARVLILNNQGVWKKWA